LDVLSELTCIAAHQYRPVSLFPLHIVFMELIIDPACSIAFEYEPEEADIMNHQPRKPDDKVFRVAKNAVECLSGRFGINDGSYNMPAFHE
jgi:hypothetical protein